MNLISSPGSGKTSVLERTLARLGDRLKVAVVEGDIQSTNRRPAHRGLRGEGHPDRDPGRLSSGRLHDRPDPARL